MFIIRHMPTLANSHPEICTSWLCALWNHKAAIKARICGVLRHTPTVAHITSNTSHSLNITTPKSDIRHNTSHFTLYPLHFTYHTTGNLFALLWKCLIFVTVPPVSSYWFSWSAESTLWAQISGDLQADTSLRPVDSMCLARNKVSWRCAVKLLCRE